MNVRDGDGEEDGESLHPRVKEELDRLNLASEEINRLENELDEARSRFSSTRNDSTQHLNALAGKIKSSVIKKARPYYEAKEKAKRAQEEALKAARQYQSANGIHRAAKETISLAEHKLCQEESARVLSSEWQEMFNHATIRLMEAEKEKRRSEEEHQMKSRIFSDAEKHMHIEEKKHKRSIARARPYFEMKADLQTKLEFLKVAVEALHDAVAQSKRKYAQALSSLEVISNQVHERRKGKKLVLHMPREPGVGAETGSPESAGMSSLSTSLDYPETPGSGDGSFAMQRDKCDVFREQEDDDEEGSDVLEGSCDVDDLNIGHAPLLSYSSPSQASCSGSVENGNSTEITPTCTNASPEFQQDLPSNKNIPATSINNDACNVHPGSGNSQENLYIESEQKSEHNIEMQGMQRPTVIGQTRVSLKPSNIPQNSGESTKTPIENSGLLKSNIVGKYQGSAVADNSRESVAKSTETFQESAISDSTQEWPVTDNSKQSTVTDNSQESVTRITETSPVPTILDSSQESTVTDNLQQSFVSGSSQQSAVTENS